MKVLPKSEWPECLLGYERLKGIFVGGCVDGKKSFRRVAHAHTAKSDHAGWICVRKAARVGDRRLMLHELAHILTDEGHTDAFYAKVAELNGGTLPEKDSKRQSRIRLASAMRRLTRDGVKHGREEYFRLRDAFYKIDKKYRVALANWPVSKARDKYSAPWREAKTAWRQEAERLLGMAE